jgi:hypothetical protein
MTVEELKDLARAVEPFSAAFEALDGRERVAYRALLFRFLERIVIARNSLVLGKAIGPDLELELRFVADALPAMRRRAEVGIRGEQSGPDE